ncbi:MAG: 4Fe-4S binding protein [Bacteroides sp.]|nr:4Fe-4S binding protein [Bacteroides sp.]
MIKIESPNQCSGCTACASICGHKAITMVPDAMGFKYPKVDPEKCIECGLCEKVCPFNDAYETPSNFPEPITMGSRLKDEVTLKYSQSGGAFVGLSDVVLNNQGIVYGCGIDSAFRAVHRRAISKEERDSLRGSKYVQSDLSDIFLQVRKDLLDGFKVLFSGTPCQTAGLNAFIPKKLRQNLILVDLVCHGVPGPAIWSSYLKYIEANYGGKVESVAFRNKKKFGWSRIHIETFTLRKKGEIDSEDFTNLFYQHLILRESCFNCPFTNLRRPSDITIGDLWGAEKVNAELANDKKGLSLVLINTPAGQDLFDQAQCRMESFPVAIKKVIQPNLRHPSKRPSARTQFEKEFEKYGFQYVLKKYGPESFRYRARYILFRLMHLPIGAFNRLKRLVTK